MFEEGDQVIMIEIMSDEKIARPEGVMPIQVSGGMPPSFTSPTETFYDRSMDISVTIAAGTGFSPQLGS